MTNIVVIDNYDSFTFNLVHGLARAGATPRVFRNDAISRDELAALGPDGLVLSPGPGTPANARDFGVCQHLIQAPINVPMLGVCLGMQGMVHHTGGDVIRAPEVVHGESRSFVPRAHAIFAGLGNNLEVGRYHSLTVNPDTLPKEWENLGVTEDGVLMAIGHRTRAWVGLQFHPESILSPDGQKMLDNFVAMCQ
jgi:para-aminobenzoate synthetase